MPPLPFVSAPARRSTGLGMRGTGMPIRVLVGALAVVLAAASGLGLALRTGPLGAQRSLGTGDTVLSSARRADGSLVVTPMRVPLDPPPAAAPAPAPEPPVAALAEAPVAPVPLAEAAEETALDTAEGEPMPSASPAEEADQAAAPPPAAPPARPRWAVAGPTSVNLRAAPSTASPVLATLAPGTVVEELGAASASSQGWRRVLWNGREGWIAATLLRPVP
jgi:hypothetical protein